MTGSVKLRVDVAIFGGGVAGLWLLARLRGLGCRAVLLESGALGAGQTRYAQGIIHGGTKYALTGIAGASADAVAAMPGIWRACLEGRGELDLRGVTQLSPNQYLWSTAGLGSRMAGFFASRVMRSRTRALGYSERPRIFQDRGFRGRVYRLDEPVLDTASLVRALAEPHRQAIFHVDWPAGLQIEPGDPAVIRLRAADGAAMALSVRRLVLAAGRGNGELLAALGRPAPQMQLRPLQMVMLRGRLPGPLYAHCLGASANPRITITTHEDAAGSPVWYVGGQLAEQGVGRSSAEQIAAARRELHELFPWVDFSDTQWATLAVDRAEPRQPDGRRPATAFLHEEDGVIVTWPTKLALAPRLAADVMARLEAAGLVGGGEPAAAHDRAGDVPPVWSHPGYAPLPWQEEERWS